MSFIKLELNGQKQCYEADLIGKISVEERRCDVCRFGHYELVVYDRNYNVVGKIVGIQKEIEKLYDEISNNLNNIDLNEKKTTGN